MMIDPNISFSQIITTICYAVIGTFGMYEWQQHIGIDTVTLTEWVMHVILPFILLTMVLLILCQHIIWYDLFEGGEPIKK